MKIGYHTIRWGYGQVALPVIISEISEAGYKAFDANDIDVASYINKKNELSKKLSEKNLQLVGIFSPLGTLISRRMQFLRIQKFNKLMELAASIGCKRFVLGGSVTSKGAVREKHYAQLSKTLSNFGKKCLDLGMEATYHPVLGTIGITRSQIDRLFEITDPAVVHLTLDTGHLAVAGVDVSGIIEAYPERIDHIHLKDVKEGRFVEVGDGAIIIPSIVKSLKSIGYKDWIIIEDEVTTGGAEGWPEDAKALLGSTTRTPLETAKRSKKYIEALLSKE